MGPELGCGIGWALVSIRGVVLTDTCIFIGCPGEIPAGLLEICNI